VSWTPLGPLCAINGDSPHAVAGSCTSIAFDPNVAGTVYVGTANGGVWKTTNRGESWVPLLDEQQTMTVGALAIARRSGHLYVGTGDANPRRQQLDRGPPVLEGRGVLISTDGGDTWRLREGFLTPGSASFAGDLMSEFRGARAAAIVIYPVPIGEQEQRIVLGSTRGLYESLDGGVNWTKLEPPASDTHTFRHRVTALALDADDPANPVLYVAIEKTGIFRREGSGALTPLPAPFPGPVDRIALAVSRPISGGARFLFTAVASSAGSLVGVARSEDRGDTWTRIDQGLVSLMNDAEDNINLDVSLALCADPEESRTVYLGAGHLYARRQFDNAWERILKKKDHAVHTGQNALVFDPHADPPTLWIANDGGVYTTADRGFSWTHRNRGLMNMQVHSVASYPTGVVALAGTQHNTAQRLVGHPIWQQVGPRFANLDTHSMSAFDVRIDWMRPTHWYVGVAMDSYGPKPGMPRQTRFGSVSFAMSNDAGGYFSEQGPSGPSAYYRRFAIDPVRPDLDQAAVWYADGPPLVSGVTDRSLQVRANPTDGWKVQPAPLFDPSTLPGGPYISAMALATRPAGSSAPFTRLHLGLSVGNYMALDITGGTYQQPASMWETLSPHPIGAVAATMGDGVIYAGQGGGRALERVEEMRNHQVLRSDTAGNGGPGGAPAFQSDIESLPSPPPGSSHRSPHDVAVNTIALDPQQPQRVLVGCDAGLFRSEDKGRTWRRWMDGLPEAMITHIDVQPMAPVGQPRMVRISTYGRGVWERPIDDEDPVVPPFGGPPSQLYLRHHAGFTRRPEPPRPDEIPEHDADLWIPNADICVDPKKSNGNYRKPKSTQNYKPDGPIDSIGFELLRRRRAELERRKKERKLRAGTDARVYLQVHNRGPGVARDVQVMMLWSRLVSEQAQELPGSFWSFSKPTMPLPNDQVVWKPLGDVIVVPEIRPADPRVVHWDWSVPRVMPKRIALLAVVHTDADTPLQGGDAFNTEEWARTDGRFALAKLDVHPVTSSGASVAEQVLGAAAILFAVGTTVYAITEMADS
jgi:photosystem II stability/assembly factor-like uncharacterized protein